MKAIITKDVWDALERKSAATVDKLMQARRLRVSHADMAAITREMCTIIGRSMDRLAHELLKKGHT